jgi:hypothetical protein
MTRTYETLDAYRRMYTFTGAPVLPGSTEKILRVVGFGRDFYIPAWLYYPETFNTDPGYNTSSGTISRFYASAVTLDVPITHTVSTYVTAYYKLILGYGANSTIYGNIWNWILRSWYHKGWGEYRKYWNCNDKGAGLIPIFTPDPNTLGSVETLKLSALAEGFQSGTYTKTFTGSRMLTGIAKDGEMSIVLYNNNYLPTVTQTFLHTVKSFSFYADLLDNIPTSTGSVRFELNEVKNPLAVSVNITKGGIIGVAEYDVDIYHGITTESDKYEVLQKSLFTGRSGGYGEFESPSYGYSYHDNYVSKNREWMIGVKYTS